MCDCLVALPPATGGPGALFAKSSDRPPDEAQRLEWHPSRRDQGPLRCTHVEIEPAPGDTIAFLASRPWWLWGVEHGVNEAGLAAGNETIFTTLDPRPAPPGLVGMDLVRLALERASTAREAVDVVTSLLERHGQGGTGHHGRHRPYWSSFLLADPADAWVVETSGTEWAAEQVGRTRAISNRTTIPDFDARHRHRGIPVEIAVDPRLEASRAVLAIEPVTLDDLVRHQRSHAGRDGWTVCMHVPGEQQTTAAMVVELGAGRPRGRFVAGSPCTSVYVPLFVGRELGEPVAWERFAVLGPEHREALDALEAGLVADATDDDAWAPEAWRRVDEGLRGLGV